MMEISLPNSFQNSHHIKITIKKKIQFKESQENQETQYNHEDPVKPLILSLSVYQDGILRLKIDEDPSLDPPKKRLEVPDIIEQEFLNKKLWLQRVISKQDSYIIYLSDGYEAVLRHDPFEVFVRVKGGKKVLYLNSHGLFDFEQLRVKKEGEDWEERFRGHTDKNLFLLLNLAHKTSIFGSELAHKASIFGSKQ